MKRIVVATLAYLCLTVAAAWAQNAVELYNRGLRSSLAYKRIAYFTRALQLNPNLVDAYEKRATHYYFQEKLDKAIQDYNRVIELKPDSVNAYLLRGLAYLKRGHGEGLIAEMNRLALRYTGLG
ncbi:MAG: tetratricopeptide repeat protein, partial [Deltaproteobacteria bacterium]